MDTSTFVENLIDDESFEPTLIYPPGHLDVIGMFGERTNPDTGIQPFFLPAYQHLDPDYQYYTNGGMNDRSVEPWLRCNVQQRFNNGYKGQINGLEMTY